MIPPARPLKRVFNMMSYGSLILWQLFFLPYIALAVVVGKHGGSPEHIAHVSVLLDFVPHLLPRALLKNRPWTQLSSIESAIYSPIIIAVKVSILLQYITIFVAHRGTPFHRAVQGLIVANVLYYTINTILFVTEVSNPIILHPRYKPRQGERC